MEFGLPLELVRRGRWSRGASHSAREGVTAADEMEAFTGLDLTPWINYSLCT